MDCINTHPIIDRPNGKPFPAIKAIVIDCDMNGFFRVDANFSTMNSLLGVHNSEGY